MDKFHLPGDLAGQFANFPERIEICDDSGFTLGYFEPALKIEPPDSKHYESLRQKFPPEELQRRMQQTGGRSTAEVFERLKKL